VRTGVGEPLATQWRCADFLSLDGDLHRRIDALVLVDEP